SRVTDLAEKAERELDLLTGVLRRVDAESFSSPRLKSLQASLRDATEQLEELARGVARLQAVRNELVKAVAGLVLWKAHCAFVLESWQGRWGREIPRWLDAV